MTDMGREAEVQLRHLDRQHWAWHTKGGLYAGRCARHAKPCQRPNLKSLCAFAHGLTISGHMVGSFPGHGQ